jgi:trk system potassium uptake protein TrkA
LRRVIARLHDPQRADQYRQLGIQFISSVRWGVHRLEQLITHPNVASVLSLGNGEVEVVEFHAPAFMAGQPIEQILSNDVRPVALTRGGHAQLLASQTVMEPGDILHLAVSRGQGGGQRLESLLQAPTREVN